MHLLILWSAIAFANGPSTDTPSPEPVSEPAPSPAPEPVPAPAPAEAKAVDLVLDGDRSEVYALLYKKGAASAVSHDHVVEAREVSGTARIDPGDPSASTVSVEVSVSGLFPDADTMRERLDLPKRLSDKQREEILGHIFSEGQLFLERYDRITFRSTSVSGTAESLQVTGDFTLRGVTRSVTVPMTVASDGDGYRATGAFRILQSDYGYEPYRALLGALQNKDEVDVVLDIALVPAG